MRIEWHCIKYMARFFRHMASIAKANPEWKGDRLNESARACIEETSRRIGSAIEKLILVVLRTNPTDRHLTLIYYPIAQAVHDSLLKRGQNVLRKPKPLSVALIFLFYKYWLDMVCSDQDKQEVEDKAKEVLTKIKYRPTPAELAPYETLLIRTHETLYHKIATGNCGW